MARNRATMEGVEYLVIAFFFGLATGIIGKGKGSSFFIWFADRRRPAAARPGRGDPLPGEKDEPERQCPRCRKALKLYVQVCPRCGEDLYLPDPAAVRHPGVAAAAGAHRSQVRTIALAKPTP